jgi:prevent-host-death family protein
MVTQVTATEAKAKLLALLDAVERGEEIEISRRGKPVARLTPARNHHRLKGMFAGRVWSNATDEELFSTGEKWDAQDE